MILIWNFGAIDLVKVTMTMFDKMGLKNSKHSFPYGEFRYFRF